MKDKLQKILDERMKKGRKKGFTLVELLVVIAIIAVLVTVSVIGYLGFTKKANVSNDTSLVAQLNTVMQGDEAINGKSDTPSEALEAVKEAGYDVTKLTPTTSDYDIVWNQETNLFALLDENGSAVYGEANSTLYYNWKFVDADDYSTTSSYSQYLNPDFDYASLVDGTNVNTLDTSAGIDAGENTDIESITYTGADTAKSGLRFNLNGGNLTVNAENDTIDLYGDTSILTITNVSKDSLYIRGQVGLIKLTNGRVVISNDENVYVQGIFLTKGKTDTTYGNSFIARMNGASLPRKVYRENISVDVGSLITTLQEVDTNGSVITGSVEEVRVTSDGVNIYSSDGNSKENPTDLGAQIINDVSSPFEQDNIDDGIIYFAGGTGIETDPYLIEDTETFQNVTHFSDKYTYFKVMDGITEIDGSKWKSITLYGSLDGNNAKIAKLNSVLIKNTPMNSDETCYVKNLNLDCNITSSGATASLFHTSPYNLVVESVNVSGSIVGTSVGGYIAYGPGNNSGAIAATTVWNVQFIDCLNTAELSSYSEGIGGFVQHPYCDMTNYNTKTTSFAETSSCITIKDSAFVGTMSALKSKANYPEQNMSYFAYQGNHVRIKQDYSSTFISELGYNPNGTLHIARTLDENGCFELGDQSKNSETTESGNWDPNYDRYLPNEEVGINKRYITSESGTTPTVGSYFEFTKAVDASKAEVSFTISPNARETETGSYTSTYLSEPIDDLVDYANGATISTKEIACWNIAINPEGATKTGLDSSTNTFNVVNSFFGRSHNGATTIIVQYNSSGRILKVTNYIVAGSNKMPIYFYNGSSWVNVGNPIIEDGTTFTFDSGITNFSSNHNPYLYYLYSGSTSLSVDTLENLQVTANGSKITISNLTNSIGNYNNLAYYIYYNDLL